MSALRRYSRIRPLCGPPPIVLAADRLNRTFVEVGLPRLRHVFDDVAGLEARGIIVVRAVRQRQAPADILVLDAKRVRKRGFAGNGI